MIEKWWHWLFGRIAELLGDEDGGCGDKVTPTKKDLFFEKIEEGNIRTVRKMVNATPSLLDEKNEYGFTPLMCAASSMERTSQLVQTLIDAGANVNAVTEEGYTALHMMIDVNGPTGTGDTPGQIARLLINAGANTEVRQHWGWTPLMRAVVEGTADELRALVNVGADVNKTFPADTLPEFMCGRTTLMATIAQPEKTNILLNGDVNLSATDAHGQTALEYARQCFAEAAEDGPDIHQITQEITDTSMAETLKQMENAGIDPDAPIDASGTTFRQSIEVSLKDTFAEADKFDYRAEVRKSISIIEKALAGP